MFRKIVLQTLVLVGLLAWLGNEVALRAQNDPASAAGAAAAADSSATGAPAERPPDTLFSIIFSGGPVGITIMLILFAVSLTAAYLVFEQILTLRRSENRSPSRRPASCARWSTCRSSALSRRCWGCWER